MESYLYGRYTQLQKLDALRKDMDQPYWRRHKADKTFRLIQKQLKDKHLMELRWRLIQATRAGDYPESWKLEQQMRFYEYRHKLRAYDGEYEPEDYEA